MKHKKLNEDCNLGERPDSKYGCLKQMKGRTGNLWNAHKLPLCAHIHHLHRLGPARNDYDTNIGVRVLTTRSELKSSKMLNQHKREPALVGSKAVSRRGLLV